MMAEGDNKSVNMLVSICAFIFFFFLFLLAILAFGGCVSTSSASLKVLLLTRRRSRIGDGPHFRYLSARDELCTASEPALTAYPPKAPPLLAVTAANGG